MKDKILNKLYGLPIVGVTHYYMYNGINNEQKSSFNSSKHKYSFNSSNNSINSSNNSFKDSKKNKN